MSKDSKGPPADGVHSTLNGGKENRTSAAPPNSGKAKSTDPPPISTNPTSNAFATTSNSPSSTPSSKRYPKPLVSSSTIHESTLQLAYERGSKSAVTAVDQIAIDIQEVRYIIANYAVEPLEMLHLGELIID